MHTGASVEVPRSCLKRATASDGGHMHALPVERVFSKLRDGDSASLIASNVDSPGEAGRAPGACPVDIPVGAAYVAWCAASPPAYQLSSK